MKLNGRELNPLHIIAVRLVCWPFIQILRALLYFFLFIGWGKDDAKEMWDKLS